MGPRARSRTATRRAGPRRSRCRGAPVDRVGRRTSRILAGRARGPPALRRRGSPRRATCARPASPRPARTAPPDRGAACRSRRAPDGGDSSALLALRAFPRAAPSGRSALRLLLAVDLALVLLRNRLLVGGILWMKIPLEGLRQAGRVQRVDHGVEQLGEAFAASSGNEVDGDLALLQLLCELLRALARLGNVDLVRRHHLRLPPQRRGARLQLAVADVEVD